MNTTHRIHPSTLHAGDVVTIKAHDPVNDPEGAWSQQAVVEKVDEVRNFEGAYLLHLQDCPNLSNAVMIGTPDGNFYIESVRRPRAALGDIDE